MNGPLRDHLDDARLEAFARYEPRFGPPALDPAEQAHLAGCAACRDRLARIEPAALFGLLAWLPEAEPLPALPVLPPRRSRRAGLRVALGAAAAVLVAAVALLALARPPVAPVLVAGAAAGADAGGGQDDGEGRIESWPGIVRRVESPTATVVTLVPPGSEGPTVTLILDEGFEL